MFSKKTSRRVLRQVAGLRVVVGLLAAMAPAQGITYGKPDTKHTYVGAIVVYNPARWQATRSAMGTGCQTPV